MPGNDDNETISNTESPPENFEKRQKMMSILRNIMKKLNGTADTLTDNAK